MGRLPNGARVRGRLPYGARVEARTAEVEYIAVECGSLYALISDEAIRPWYLECGIHTSVCDAWLSVWCVSTPATFWSADGWPCIQR